MNPSIRQVFACIMEANLPKISGTNRQLKNLPEIRKTLKLPATGSIQGSLNRLRACPKRRGCPSSSVLYGLSQTFSGVGVRITPTFTPPSVFFRELDGRSKSVAPERFSAINLPQHHYSTSEHHPPATSCLATHRERLPVSYAPRESQTWRCLREEQGVSDGDEISARFLNLWTGRTPP